MGDMNNFLNELEQLINRYSKESGSDTPDFILAEYLQGCLDNFNKTLVRREKWYGREIHQKGSPIGISSVPPS